MAIQYDAAIVGGGVVGSSIAYYMAKRGMKVVLLERDRIAGQSSGAAAGMLAAQAEMDKDGPLFALARKSRAMFPGLAEELKEWCGIDIGLTRRGMLKVAPSREEAAQLQQILAFQRQAGEEGEWLTPEEARRREPGLAEDVAGAMYIPQDGHVLAPELTNAFAKSAAILGAQIREFAEVKSLVLERGRAIGLTTHDGVIHCDRIVVASGAWSGHLLQQAGIALPIYPVKGECFSVLSHAPLVRSTVFSHGCYLVPKRGGRLIVGATMLEHCYDRKVSVAGISALLDRAKRLFPGIVVAEWEKAWSGIRPQTADGLPYLGESAEWKGLYVAAGHFRNGILLSPITGELVADWAEGKTDSARAAEPFRLERGSLTPGGRMWEHAAGN